MAKMSKAIQRLLSKPSDFSWNEMVALMTSLGYEVRYGDGSSRKFIHPTTKATLIMHEPHKPQIVKAYIIRATINFLRQEKHI